MTSRQALRWASLGVGVVALGGAVWMEERLLRTDLWRARDLHGAAHVGSATCRGCHPDQAASWRRTFHRTMTQDATVRADAAAARPGGAGNPAANPAVLGDFSGVTYRYFGVDARMDRDPAGRYRMTFTRPRPGAPGGEQRSEAIVVRTVGSRRYQQYLAEVRGSLWRLPMAFDVEGRRWFHMNGAFLFEERPDELPEPWQTKAAISARTARANHAPVAEAVPARPVFGGGDYDRHVTRWNDNCVFCHNVAPNPGMDDATSVDAQGEAEPAFRTTVAELGVGCEACHGPGEEHARRNADPVRRKLLTLARDVAAARDPTIVNPARLTPDRAAALCGRCHGQRIAADVRPFLTHGDPFVPGDDLAQTSTPLWRDTTLRGQPGVFAARFWDDGTARLTAYEYQGLLQSACASRGGLTCTTCHGMHGADPRGQVRAEAREDRACTGCHVQLATPGEAARHSRHDPAGSGARCLGCHMPKIVYGVLAVHRSHRIERPDPAAAARTGRPDACTLCHVEKDRAWAIAEWRERWGKKDEINDDSRGAEDGSTPSDHLAPLDALFAGDAVTRAVAAGALGSAPLPTGGEEAAAPVRARRLAALIDVMDTETYPAIRRIAARSVVELLAPTCPGAAEVARAFDATGPAAERAARIRELRAHPEWQAQRIARLDPVRVAVLRSRSRTESGNDGLEIGE